MNRSDQHEVLERFFRTYIREVHNLKKYPEILWQQMYNRLQWADEGSKDSPVLKTPVEQCHRLRRQRRKCIYS
jgi:hypothetical protein